MSLGLALNQFRLTDYSATQSPLAMNLNPDEATAALAQIEQARLTMRRLIRAHRGHQQLWLWGAMWIAMPLAVQFRGMAAMQWFPLACSLAGILSFALGFFQGRQIRAPINVQFLGVIATIVAFGALFPFLLHPHGPVDGGKALYAYACLIAMQAYVVAGLWTDRYLLWVGLIVTGFILIGYFLLPGIFWWWMAGFGGGTLFLTGFYVRLCWR